MRPAPSKSARPSRLDQRFVDVAHGPGNRTSTIVVVGIVALAVAWIHGLGGWMAAATLSLLGLVGGWLDRAAANRDWERLSRLTLREVANRGESGLAPVSGFRKALPLVALAAGAVLLFRFSDRGKTAIVLTIPFLYAAWRFGGDLMLAVAPPGRGKGM